MKKLKKCTKEEIIQIITNIMDNNPNHVCYLKEESIQLKKFHRIDIILQEEDN